MKASSLGAVCACTAALLLGGLGQAALVTISFDSLPAMVNVPGTAVPLESQLSDQLLPSTGATFSSAPGYVAVVTMGAHQYTEMPKI